MIPISESLHCPLLAVAEGFLCTVKLPGIVDFLSNVKPLFFPDGEQLTGKCLTTEGTVYHALFLPEVCNIPLGIAWPTTIGYEDLYLSIQALKAGYSNFLTILTAIQPQLAKWLSMVAQDPTSFMSSSLLFLDLHPHGYPSIDTGDFPEAVLDSQAFSPLLEMALGFLWCLTSDLALTIGTNEIQKAFATFLAHGEIAIITDSYLGEVIPGHFCPNFAYNFAVVAHWPTNINPLAEIILPSLVSE